MTRTAAFFLVSGSLLICFPSPELPAQPLHDSLAEQPYITLNDSLIHYEKQNLEDIRILEITDAWILIDSTGQLEIEEVADPQYADQFSPNVFKDGSFPIDLVVWVRLRLQGFSGTAIQQYELFLHDYVFPSCIFEKTESGQLIPRPSGPLCHLPYRPEWRLRRIGTLAFFEDAQKEIFFRVERSSPFRVKTADHWAKVRILISAERTFSTYWWMKIGLDWFFSGLYLCLVLLFLILMRSVKEASLKWLTLTILLFILSSNFDIVGYFLPGVLMNWLQPLAFCGGIITLSLFMHVYSRQRMHIAVLEKCYRLWPIFLFVFPLVLETAIQLSVTTSNDPQLGQLINRVFQVLLEITRFGTVLLIFAFTLSFIVKKKEERSFLVILLSIWAGFVLINYLLSLSGIIIAGITFEFVSRTVFAAFAIAFVQIIGNRYRKSQQERTAAIQDKLALQQNLNRRLEDQVRARTAELQQKNQHLLKLDQEKNNLINIVAHDLGSPLASIRMYSGIVQKAKDKLSPKQQEYLDGISTTAQRSVEMIRRILDVNAIDQNGQQLALRPTDIVPILQAAVNDFHGLAGRKDIQLMTEWPEGPIQLHVDPAAFRQVIDNLLSNAVKFSPAGKTVTAGLEKAENSDTIRIYVRDQGPGIGPEDMPRLFQRYARLAAQPTGGETSTGLGLAIVRQYVEAMGGRVWAENNETEGVTFQVAL